jgi:hypothetical protein
MLVSAFIAFSACGAAETGKPGLRKSAAIHPSAGPEALLAAPPTDLAAIVRDRYRLQLDRRLLDAVAEIRRLQAGGVPRPVTAEFREGKWLIFSGHEEVGVLAEFPDFEEVTALLTRWAGRLEPASVTVASASADTGVLGHLESAIRAVDAAALLEGLASFSGSPVDVQRDPTRTNTIGLSLAWLATLTLDHLDQADPLLTEAWAWLALERVAAPDRTSQTDVLLAMALGYQAAAARLGARLPETDAVRYYGQSDEPHLGALCAGRSTDRPCHFLRLALLAESQHVERFRSAIHQSPFRDETSLAVLSLESRLADFDAGPVPGRELASRTIEEALRRPGRDSSHQGPSFEALVEASTRDFETAVDQIATGPEEGLIPHSAIRAGYRAPFYSGIFQEARFVIDQLASAAAAQDLADRFENPAAGTADQLRRWIEVSAQRLSGPPDLQSAVALLTSADSIGATPLAELASLLARHSQSTEPLRRLPIPTLFARLDTRPASRVIAARVAQRNLVAPGLFETLARAAVEAAPHRSQELPATVAALNEDSTSLRQIVEDPAMPAYAQVVALDYLAKFGQVDDGFVREHYEEMARDPDEGQGPLIGFLESRNDFAGAIAALDTIRQRGRHQGLALVHLQTEKARLQLHMGNANGAYATIAPVLDSFKEETLLQGAYIELARHRAKEALALAEAALERYPDRSSETSGLIARARWQLSDYSTAAKELAASRNGIVSAWSRYLPEGFAESFATAPEQAVFSAFSELAAAGIAPHVLADVAIALGKRRGLDIALPLLEGLRDPAPEWHEYIRLAGYELIREKADASAALVWLRKQMPRPSHGFGLHLYQMRNYPLLLDLFANSSEGGNPATVRLLKAAAHLHLLETQGPRWDGLVAEIKADPGDDFFARAARYLGGLTDDTLVMQSVKNVDDLAGIGWVKGVRALSEARFAEADRWFQVALESGQNQLPPHGWSWAEESDWLNSERSLEFLQRRVALEGSAAN